MFLNLVLALEKEGRLKDAVEVATEGLSQFPYEGALYRRAGRLRAEVCRPDEALVFLKNLSNWNRLFPGTPNEISHPFLQKKVS